ncbi:hypothetical protein WJX73_001851 [Symbiochloris irregularis]|uniref:Uncharacterized protein n=1 Tax=Symbiochloris irregularis TaxID=706552 RepID=A0AAW1PNL0_9CHLO
MALRPSRSALTIGGKFKTLPSGGVALISQRDQPLPSRLRVRLGAPEPACTHPMPKVPLPQTQGRAAQSWLLDLKRAKDESAVQRAKVTLADVIERANDASAQGALDPNSPRSVEAFLRVGIDPCDLRVITANQFKQILKKDKADLAEMAYQFHESQRQERIKAVLDERKAIIEQADTAPKKKVVKGPAIAVAGVEVGDMVQKEAKRLEVTRRRQERELGQMVSYEVTRKEQQDKAEGKVRALEAKAAQQRKEKEAASAQWRDAQRQRELKRLQEQQEREETARQLEAARYQREIEMAKRDAVAEEQRRKAGYLLEQERMEKVEQARKETERILAEQAAEVDRKKADMVKRDQVREAAKAEREEAVRLHNQEVAAKAAERIQGALKSNQTLLKQRREEYNARQQENEKRRQEKELVRQAADREARAKEVEAEKQRQEAYRAAMERESTRVHRVLEKNDVKEQSLEVTYHNREHENARIALARQLELDLKRKKVEEMQRKQLYQREMLLQRIAQDTEKTFSMKESRAELQEARRRANMQSSFERQNLMQSIERLQATKKLSKFVGGDGSVNLGALMATQH